MDHFRPPEACGVSAEWGRPLNGQRYAKVNGRVSEKECRQAVIDSQDAYGIKFTSAHNVWGIGKTIHDLEFLKHPHEYRRDFDEAPAGSTLRRARAAVLPPGYARRCGSTRKSGLRRRFGRPHQ